MDKPRYLLKKLLMLVFILVLALGAYGYSAYNAMLKPVDLQNPQTRSISVPAGASSLKISKILFDAGLVRHQLAFRIYSRYQGLANKLQAGEYSLNTGMSVPEIARRISGGEVNRR